MRKTIILAVAVTVLAGASMVTGLARSVQNPLNHIISARPVIHPLVTGGLTASVLPST
jgi:hypothetical protein